MINMPMAVIALEQIKNWTPAAIQKYLQPLTGAVAEGAKERGYTEPHPRDDLMGLDVARKLVISCGDEYDLSVVDVSTFCLFECGSLLSVLFVATSSFIRHGSTRRFG